MAQRLFKWAIVGATLVPMAAKAEIVHLICSPLTADSDQSWHFDLDMSRKIALSGVYSQGGRNSFDLQLVKNERMVMDETQIRWTGSKVAEVVDGAHVVVDHTSDDFTLDRMSLRLHAWAVNDPPVDRWQCARQEQRQL